MKLKIKFSQIKKIEKKLHRGIPYATIPLNDGKDLKRLRFTTFVENTIHQHSQMRIWTYKHIYPMSSVLHKWNQLLLGLSPPGTFHHQHPYTSNKNNTWILPTMTNLTDTLPRFLDKICPDFASAISSSSSSSSSSSVNF